MRKDAVRPHLVVAAVCLVAFAALALLVASPHPAAADARALTAIARHRTPLAIRLAWNLSRLGNPKAAGVIAGLAIAALFARRRLREATALAIACSGAAFLDVGLKALVRRPSPHLDYDDSLVPGFSFPSGHALGAVALYGMLAFLLRGRARGVVTPLALAATLAIGAPRLVLAVHWPTDVLGGYLIGVAWLETCLACLITATAHDEARPGRTRA